MGVLDGRTDGTARLVLGGGSGVELVVWASAVVGGSVCFSGGCWLMGGFVSSFSVGFGVQFHRYKFRNIINRARTLP